MKYTVVCEYIDDDGCENIDTNVATMDNHDDAWAYATQLKLDDGVIKSYVWTSNL